MRQTQRPQITCPTVTPPSGEAAQTPASATSKVGVGQGGVGTVSRVAQTVKHLPAMWETQVRSLGWEDPLDHKVFLTIQW